MHWDGGDAMQVAQKGRMDVAPSGGALGAEVRGIDLSKPIDDDTMAGIKEAWNEHLFLCFRAQKLNDDQLVAIARRFGEPHIVTVIGYNREGLRPEIDVVSNIVIGGQPIGAAGAHELAWHTDMSMFEYPASATVNYGAEIPADGPTTRFANMYTAYEALPRAVKDKLHGLKSSHDARGYAGIDENNDPVAVHPIARTHPQTGRKALFLARPNRGHVEGLDAGEGESLLKMLWDHMRQPEYVWEHKWQQSDLVIWDNRCLIHSRGAFDSNTRRVLRRVTVMGERPV
jgi:taurine dioxygenase